MTQKQLIVIVAATAMVAVTQTAQASIDYSQSATLAQLAANSGNYLTIGDKIFNSFSDLPSGLTGFNAADITVTASAAGNVDYLTWSGNISLTSAGAFLSTASADLLLNYVVTATGGNKINEIDQQYTGNVAYGGGGIGVAETVTTPGIGGQVGSTYLSSTYTYEPNVTDVPISLNGSKPYIIPPQAVLDVTKDISLSTVNVVPIPGAPGYYEASVSLSQVTQSFHQVPEPTTMIAGALLLLPFGASTLRILRKNRTA